MLNEIFKMNNQFGGDWTEAKIEILVEYAKAYLIIMHKHADKFNWKLLYFDGFAGSGYIIKGKDDNQKIIVGAAKRILEINQPRPFDLYYFVEKQPDYTEELINKVVNNYKERKIKVVTADCNEKLKSMANFLKSNQGKKHRVLAYIDPCGMQVNWKSLKVLEGLAVDAWVLAPTGLGVNRLLVKNGEISDSWLKKLEIYLGMSKTDILSYFYNQTTTPTLFGDEVKINKEQRAVEKIAELYGLRLKKIFTYVTQPYILKNKTNSVMFHFYMVSNNKTANKIGNEIIKKYNNN